MRWTARDARSLGVALLYLGPSFILFAAFVFIPLGRTIYLSFFFTRQSGAISTFAGLDQYTELLTSPMVTAVRDCAAPECTLLFVPAHPRRQWCSAARCGNRARVARYYEAHKG